MGSKERGEEHSNWSGNYCHNGHERTPDNTYIKKQVSRGHLLDTRICKECQRNYYNKFMTKQARVPQDI